MTERRKLCNLLDRGKKSAYGFYTDLKIYAKMYFQPIILIIYTEKKFYVTFCPCGVLRHPLLYYEMSRAFVLIKLLMKIKMLHCDCFIFLKAHRWHNAQTVLFNLGEQHRSRLSELLQMHAASHSTMFPSGGKKKLKPEQGVIKN